MSMRPSMSLITELAERAHLVSKELVPSGISAAARRHLTDTVAALAAGYTTLHSRAESLAADLGLPDAPASSPGSIRRSAFLGGVYSHCWEVDDVHREAVLCPGCVILPATLAILDLRPETSWDEYLRSYIAGYEVALAAAIAIRSDRLISAGWWPTGLIGPLGGAAAVSVLLGRTVEETGAAIALAAQQAGGLIAGTTAGADGRYLQGGLAAERAVTAVLTVGSGWYGPVDVLDDARSPLRRSGDSSASGTGGYLLPSTSMKPHAGAKHLQAAIDCVQSIRTKLSSDADDVLAMTCYLPHQLAQIVDRPPPFRSVLGALTSAQFVLALATLKGRSIPLDFGAKALDDEKIIALANKINVVPDTALSQAYPCSWGARVEITTGGGTLSATRTEARGDPGQELSKEEILAKFTMLASEALGARTASDVAASLLNETAEPIKMLTRYILPLLRTPSGDA
jgi:2-methylcitrate dehydratase PrpD